MTQPEDENPLPHERLLPHPAVIPPQEMPRRSNKVTAKEEDVLKRDTFPPAAPEIPAPELHAPPATVIANDRNSTLDLLDDLGFSRRLHRPRGYRVGRTVGDDKGIRKGEKRISVQTDEIPTFLV